ncbi:MULTISPECIES: aromatic amino acid transaminase [unclassified Streptomyces]|uniref:amino acid aminotransferase n=1 Tax=unclassified Streptomyces TaxID=2593676 RepID=UPI001BECC41B|nr:MULTISPECIES: aromatic amino acid transaminase [unclassified Streptomyces]MBT2403245.1 aspartate/tyrosine/aromatic aminotransferase [Streptomyces sp. ISL-21]MBT2457413.1 aspartate/tyrosine/aromatic aminotransferase [Streptomyces sp. ISL-86]MBT2609799.1 aspartate/tyrosine/aromatic aminotransferase [Streptomyces sp. ISL-87]
MLELLLPPPVDPLWDLTEAFGADARPERLNLVLGVYRDHTGGTPVMAAVREAEIRLAERSESKEYRGLSGNGAFNRAMVSMVLGTGEAAERAVAVQTVAGSGALRLLADLVCRTRPGTTVWISDPAYVNHRPILEAAGLTVRTYGWLDAEGRSDTAAMLRDLEDARRDDVVLLQGCCHNPTGVDPSPQAWEAVAELSVRNGWVPFVDLAYHGLGDGLEADLAATRMLAERVPEMLIAISCSKNFGLYSDRTGCAVVLGASRQALRHAETALQNAARTLYSMPPEHGAAVVTAILEDDGLRAAWRAELDAMRGRITANRSDLTAQLMGLGWESQAESLARQKGMFSMLPLTPDQMLRLRSQFAIYGTTSGRVNIAGIPADRIPCLAQGIAGVLDAVRDGVSDRA